MSDVALDPAPDIEAAENVEKKADNLPEVSWVGEPSREADEAIKLEAARVAEAMRRMGLTDEDIRSTFVGMLDSRRVAGDSLHRGHYSYMPDGVTTADGEHLDYKHFILLGVRADSGELLSNSELDEKFYHELAHLKQQTQGVKFEHLVGEADPRYKKVAKWFGRLTAGGYAAAAWANLGAQYAFRHEYFLEALNKVTECRYASAIAIAGMGVVAAAATIGAPSIAKSHENIARSYIHKLSPYEKEARANESMAQEFPVFNVAAESESDIISE